MPFRGKFNFYYSKPPKEITPIKVTKRGETPNSTNGKTNPMSNNRGYADHYTKRKVSKEAFTRHKNGKFIKKHHTTQDLDLRSRSVIAKVSGDYLNYLGTI